MFWPAFQTLRQGFECLLVVLLVDVVIVGQLVEIVSQHPLLLDHVSPIHLSFIKGLLLVCYALLEGLLPVIVWCEVQIPLLLYEELVKCLVSQHAGLEGVKCLLLLLLVREPLRIEVRLSLIEPLQLDV